MENKTIYKLLLVILVFGFLVTILFFILKKPLKKSEVFYSGNLKSSKIVFSASGSTSLGGNFNLKVVLTDTNGSPLANQKIFFTYDQNWNYAVPVRTKSDGIAEYSMPIANNPNTTGFINGKNYQFNAYFQGNNEYKSVHAYENITISGTKSFSITKTSSTKNYSVESIPYIPWASSSGNDGISFPHGALYYQTWSEVSYNFISNRSNITLPDGKTIQKPIIYGMYFYGDKGDLSPSSVGEYTVPAGICPGGATTVPKYCDTNWMNAYLAQVADLGKNLDGKIDGVMVSFGFDGEANFVKSYSACEEYLRKTYSCTSSKFSGLLKQAIDAHIKAFPNTPVFVQGHPEGPVEAISKGYGYKLNSFTPSSGDWNYGNGVGYNTWIKYPDMYKAFESKIGGSGLYRSYWMILNMLNPKPDFIDFFPNHWAVFKKLPWFYDFVFNTLGKENNNTDHVWSVSRETGDNTKKENSLYPGQLSGYYGDFQYYLYRKENIVGNKTIPMKYSDSVFRKTYKENNANDFEYDQPFTNRSEEGPIADINNNYQPQKGVIYNTARKNAPGNNFMSYDIDNGWQYAGLVPNSNLSYEIVLIYLDNGTDTLSIEYYDGNNKPKTINIQKTNTGRWIRTSDSDNTKIVVNDAFFNDQFEGMTDIRINNNSDGDEIVHMLEVKGFGKGGIPSTPPTSVPAPKSTILPTSIPTNFPIISPKPTPFFTPVITPTPRLTPTPTPIIGACSCEENGNIYNNVLYQCSYDANYQYAEFRIMYQGLPIASMETTSSQNNWYFVPRISGANLECRVCQNINNCSGWINTN